jgi:hypothetical protein
VKLLLLVLLSAAGAAQAALDAEGVPIGAREADIKKPFPSAYCKPLEWKSRVADRRCDDGKGRFAGATVRITFYLRQDAVEAFDVRFSRRDTDRIAAALVERYGKPALEKRDDKGLRLEWREQAVRAVLDAPADKRRGSLLVARGNFEDEIYKVH